MNTEPNDAFANALRGYVHSMLREPEILRRLREETQTDPLAVMQTPPEQGQFIAFLVKALNVRRALELGTFTGYSTLSIALALPADGRLETCDISHRRTSVARRFWQEAGVADRITLHLRPALLTLDSLLARGGASSFDFAFIDADKENYDQYYERTLALLRSGGVALVDNVLLSGGVVEGAPQPASATSQFTADQIDVMRRLNRKIRDDDRVDATLLPIADGVMLVRKR